MNTQKQTRLDQFEIKEFIGLFPDFQLTRRARLISAALNRYDVRRAGGSYYNHYFKRELGERIEDRDGVPHLFRESYERKGGKWEYCLIDCGKVRDEEKRAGVLRGVLGVVCGAGAAGRVRGAGGRSPLYQHHGRRAQLFVH